MTKPYGYQIDGVNAIADFNGRALLGDEMGLGKSFQSLLFAQLKSDARPIVIVCEAGLKWNWDRECKTHIGVRAEVLEGLKAPTSLKVINPPQIIIVNYDILKAWIGILRKLKPQMILLDEVHKIKNPRAQRTKKVRQLCKGVPYVIGIGGTPIKNRPIEFWPILHLLRPDVFNSKREFAFRYCKPTLTPWGWKFDGACNLKELNVLLRKTCLIRRLKKDVMSELPAKQRFIVPLEIKRRREYEAAEKDFIKWLRTISPGKAMRASRAKQFVRTGYLKRLVAELKLQAVFDWIDSCLAESTGKLLLVCYHTEIIKQLHERYKRISVVIDGSVTGKKRHNAVDKFQTDKDTRVCITQLTVTVGWNATAANTVGVVELGYVPGDHTQAEDRTHRIGQLKNVSVYYLVGRNTIEERLCQIIREKQAVVAAALDGEEVSEDFSAFDQLISEMRHKRKTR